MSHLLRFNTLCKILDRWEPGLLHDERAYQDSLEKYLHTQFPKASIRKEYAHLGRRCDFLVIQIGRLGGRTATVIELKANLCLQADFDRLLSQVSDLQSGRNNVVILLCGESRRDFAEQLTKHLSQVSTLGALRFLSDPYQTVVMVKGNLR